MIRLFCKHKFKVVDRNQFRSGDGWKEAFYEECAKCGKEREFTRWI